MTQLLGQKKIDATYIAKEIITAHGGRMWVESKLGKGSVFHFSLPRVLENESEFKGTSSVTVQGDQVSKHH